MDGEPFRDHRIYFPKDLLKAGENVVKVYYESKYARDCQGMHYFLDKEDGEEYLYTQFEAADAHMVFPCFDQPNIKAPYELMTLVPKGWLALSTSTQSKPTILSSDYAAFISQLEDYGLDPVDFVILLGDEEFSCYQFGISPKISCYLYSCIAGPYCTIESNQPAVKNYKFPLKLYCR